jgi:hypothetical protein
MTDRELLEAIAAENRQERLAALQEELESALAQPDAELDAEQINALTAEIDRLTDREQATAMQSQQGIRRLKQNIRAEKRRRCIRHIMRAAAAVCGLLLAVNLWSYLAQGKSVFAGFQEHRSTGIVLQLDDIPVMPAQNPCADDMQQKYAELGIVPRVPAYLPVGFLPETPFSEADRTERFTEIVFRFARARQTLQITARQFTGNPEMYYVETDSDDFNTTVQQIGDVTVYTVKEKQHYTAAFQIGQTQYTLEANGLDFDECQLVLASMFS